MTLKKKLLTGAGLLVVSTGFAFAAPGIVQSSVNLRTGPGVDFPVVAAMPAGAPIDVMGCSENWCRVAFGRTVGFADRDFLAPGGRGGPGYTTFGEGYGPGPGDRYSYGASPGYTTGYGNAPYGGNGYGNTAQPQPQTTGAIKGNNPMRIRKSTANPNLPRPQGQATALKGNNPMRVRKSTANPNLKPGPASAIKGNNPMKVGSSTTATTNRPTQRRRETTGAAPRQPQY